MLTKAQSMGEVFASPSSRQQRDDSPSRAPQPSFGPSTPRKNLARTLSLPVSPFDSPGKSGAASRPPLEAEKLKRTYGKNRTYLEDRPDTQLMETNAIDEQDSKDIATTESYDELRKRFEVDNSFQAEGGSPGSLMQVRILTFDFACSDCC